MMNAKENSAGSLQCWHKRVPSELSCPSHPWHCVTWEKELHSWVKCGLKGMFGTTSRLGCSKSELRWGHLMHGLRTLEIMHIILFASTDSISCSFFFFFLISLRFWVGDRQIVLQILKSYMNCKFFSFYPLLPMKESVLHAQAIQGWYTTYQGSYLFLFIPHYTVLGRVRESTEIKKNFRHTFILLPLKFLWDSVYLIFINYIQHQAFHCAALFRSSWRCWSSVKEVDQGLLS